MKVADFIIQRLAEEGIREAFIVYGAANGDLVDAFTRTDKIRYVCVMHEQAGGFAAEGYAKISGKPGLAIATSGPGGMNFVTPIGNCYYDSVPCLFITGQINTKFLRPDPSIRQVGFQETDIVGIVRPITKYAKMVTSPKEIRFELEKALFLARSGRPGPVLLDIPLNIQKQDINPNELIGFDAESAKTTYDLDAVDRKIGRYIDDLMRAERPVMLIGGGVRMAHAVDAFRDAARLLKIPCFPTWNALDVVTSDFPYYGGRVGTYGGRGRNFGLQNSDLVLAVGSRISGRITGGNIETFLRGAKKWVVDVDQSLLQPHLQQVPFDETIHCDAHVFFDAFYRILRKRLRDGLDKRIQSYFSKWMDRCAKWRDKYDPVLPEYYHQKDHANPYVFFRILSEEMSARDILVGDCGGNIVVSNHAFETKFGQRNITNNGNSPMGFSFAGALGAWFASDKAQQVVCTIGDGGFNMNIQEIQTFLNYKARVKTFIVDNRIYGITKAFQKTNFEGRIEACGPKGYNPPDFVKVCNAYGMRTVVIKSNGKIREKVREVLSATEPVVCVVDCEDWHSYEPRIFGLKTPIEDMYPYLEREEFLSNMSIEPVSGWETPDMPGKLAKEKKS